MEKNRFFDFKNGENFNLDEEYKTLFNDGVLEPLDPNDVKLKDAESIIQELGSVYIEGLSLQKYEEIFVNLSEFLSKFRVDSEEVKNMTRESRDKLFGYGKELFSSYQTQYGNLHFNFELTLKEWNYIHTTLTKKISYNGQELFNYWELYTKFLEPTANTASKLPKQLDSFVPVASIQNLILLSHLLMKHEEKGSTESFHHFRTVLTEMAKMTKLFNAYGVMLERVTSIFNNWVNALNVMDEYNDNTTENVLTNNELQQ